jgi:antitoxin MazE
MLKRLTKLGNSLALVIDPGVLDLLEIDADTPLSITTDGECLIIAPVRDEARRKRFQEAVREGNRVHGRALRRLADRP